MRRQALEPRPGWVRRLRRRDPEAERRLEDEVRKDHGADPECERGKESRLVEPAAGSDQQEPRSQYEADSIVPGPAGRAFEPLRFRAPDVRMPERAAGKMPDPAPEQAVVERRDAEHRPEEEVPEVHPQRGVGTNGERSEQGIVRYCIQRRIHALITPAG